VPLHDYCTVLLLPGKRKSVKMKVIPKHKQAGVAMEPAWT
jgi:hypothetical protein